MPKLFLKCYSKLKVSVNHDDAMMREMCEKEAGGRGRKSKKTRRERISQEEHPKMNNASEKAR